MIYYFLYLDLKRRYKNLQKEFNHLADLLDLEFWEEVEKCEDLCS